MVYALRETRAGANIALVDLSDDGGTASVYFYGGDPLEINVDVNGDGALAAIIDVCKALMEV